MALCYYEMHVCFTQNGTYFKKISQTVSTEKSVKAHMAVRFVSLLLKSSFVELLQAETEMFIFYPCPHFTMTLLPADKALGVELPEHGGDAATLYGLAAVGAHPGAEQ